MTGPTRRLVNAGFLATLAAGCAGPAGAPVEAKAPDAAAIPPQFPLRREQGKRHLVDSAGRPFFLHGDTCWSIVAELTREDADVYLRDRAARGVNAILTSTLVRYHARNAPRNAAGAHPFRSGALDFAEPNEAYFAQVDWVFDRAAALGMAVLTAPANFGFGGGQGGFYQELRAVGPERVRAYARYVGARYAGRDNILWVMAGDYTPPEMEIVRAIAAGIREGGSKGLMMAHPRGFQSGFDAFGGETWLDVNTLYTYGSMAEMAAREYARPGPLPFILFESFYENEHDSKPLRHRQQAYEALLHGACGHIFGNNPMWYFTGPGLQGVYRDDWKQQLGGEGSRAMQVLREVFLSVDWPRLAPDRDNRFLPPMGDPLETRPVAATAETFAIAYTPRGGALKVDFGRLRGRPTAAWVDPVDGRRIPVEGALSGVRDLATPGPNAGAAADWVLVAQ